MKKESGFRQKMIAAILLVAALGILAVSGVSYLQFRKQNISDYVENIDKQASIQLQKFDDTMKEAYLNMAQISNSEELAELITEYIDSDHGFQAAEKLSDELKELLKMQEYDSTLYLYLQETSEMFSTQDYYNRQELDRSNILLWRTKQEEAFQPLFFINYLTGSEEYVFGYAGTRVFDTCF